MEFTKGKGVILYGTEKEHLTSALLYIRLDLDVLLHAVTRWQLIGA